MRSGARRARRAERIRRQKNNRHELQVWFTPELAAEPRRSADLAAALAAERARGDRLELTLAEGRRPWLVRAIEGLRRKPAP